MLLHCVNFAGHGLNSEFICSRDVAEVLCSAKPFPRFQTIYEKRPL